MKSKKNLLEQLKSLPHFNKSTIYQLGKQLGLKDTTVDTYISRFLKYKEILQLKNGVYISADFFEKNKMDISYSFYLANIIRTPSYVSSWAALEYYNLATEAIHSITSVTPKVTRNYQTKAGNFAYQSINKDLFSDFSLAKGKPASSAGGFDFYIASPAKALFDLLYFRTRQFRLPAEVLPARRSLGEGGAKEGRRRGEGGAKEGGVKLEIIKALIEELRIDFGEMDKAEQEKFYSMIKKFI